MKRKLAIIFLISLAVCMLYPSLWFSVFEPHEHNQTESLGSVIITPDQTIIVNEPVQQNTTMIQSNEPSIIIPGFQSDLPQGISQNSLIADIFSRVNAERKDNGLNELTYNAELQESANVRSAEASELFSHTRPNGKSCHSVVENFDYIVTGENLILADKQIATAKRMVEEWMNSEGHRHNILLKDFTSTAIGVTEKNGQVFVAQIFLG